MTCCADLEWRCVTMLTVEKRGYQPNRNAAVLHVNKVVISVYVTYCYIITCVCTTLKHGNEGFIYHVAFCLKRGVKEGSVDPLILGLTGCGCVLFGVTDQSFNRCGFDLKSTRRTGKPHHGFIEI